MRVWQARGLRFGFPAVLLVAAGLAAWSQGAQAPASQPEGRESTSLEQRVTRLEEELRRLRSQRQGVGPRVEVRRDVTTGVGGSPPGPASGEAGGGGSYYGRSGTVTVTPGVGAGGGMGGIGAMVLGGPGGLSGVAPFAGLGLPAAIAVDGDNVYILRGNMVYRLNAGTLDIQRSQRLPEP